MTDDRTDGLAAPAVPPRRPDPRDMPRRAVLVARPVGTPAPEHAQEPDADGELPRS
jgi:hypothetical protein